MHDFNEMFHCAVSDLGTSPITISDISFCAGFTAVHSEKKSPRPRLI